MNLFELIIFGTIVYLIYVGIKTFRNSKQAGFLGQAQDGASEVVSEITKGAGLIGNQIGSYSIRLKMSAINTSVKKILKKDTKMTFGASAKMTGTYWAFSKAKGQFLTGPFGKDRDPESWNLRFYNISYQDQTGYTEDRLDSFFDEVSKHKRLREYCKENNIQFLTITPVVNISAVDGILRSLGQNLYKVYKLTGEQWVLIHSKELSTEWEWWNGLSSKWKSMLKLGVNVPKDNEIGEEELKEIHNLTELHLSENQITDLSPLEKLTNLTGLDLGQNQITDLTPLEKLTNLTGLLLGQNQITDLTPLEKLTNLRHFVR